MKTRIKELREARGLTQDQLAEAAGLSKRYLSELENGRKQLNARRIESLARALKVSPFDLIDDPSMPQDVLDILRMLRDLDPHDRAAVLGHARALRATKDK